MNTILTNLRNNWKSGITVSLVSIPLSVSLAVASQTSPIVGIITAIWAGLIASILGGSNYNIIGPTGALSGLLAAYALTHGAPTLAPLAIVAGIFILIAYIGKLERFLVFVPASTVQGFTLGVAIIISLGQLNFALGLSNLPKHEKLLLNVFESIKHLGQTSPETVLVFLTFLAGLFFFVKYLPKIPGAIALAPIGILLGYLSTKGIIPLKLLTLGNKYPDMQGTLFIMPQLSFDFSLIQAGVAVAVIAILETMISAKIADGMTKTHHNGRKEMFGLGIANIVSGFAGGMPATAALARTSLNVKSGADNKISATISSIAVAVISMIFLTYFAYIPLAVIAAILVFTAIRMVETHHLAHIWKHDKRGYAIAMLVSIVCIYDDPIVGILLGTAISLIVFMEKLSRGQFDLDMNDIKTGKTKHMHGEQLDANSKDSHILTYSIKGQLAYVNGQAHISRFERNLQQYHAVIIRLRELHFIDIDGVNALDEMIDLIKAQNKPVALSGVNKHIEESLQQESEGYKLLRKEGLIFPKTLDALKHFGFTPE
jgi:SulP family sulfate permease